MKFTGNGWTAELKLKPGKYAYKYIIDGQWTTDPGNKLRERGEAGAYNSVVYCTNHRFELKGFKNAHQVVDGKKSCSHRQLQHSKKWEGKFTITSQQIK